MNWKKMLKTGYTSGSGVKEILRLRVEEAEAINKIAEEYPMYVNEYYMSLIDPTDSHDPIRKMASPSAWEFESGGSADTSGEGENTVLPGMQHKYGQTVLILSTSQCAMYCRHCFRKRMVGQHEKETASCMGEMADYIRSHPEINNVLISGGDAFLNANQRIQSYLECFSQLEQLDFIRFGTRTPVVLPQRILEDEELLDILKTYNQKKQIYVVTQFNHPREVTDLAVQAVRELNRRGIVVKNQTVLLRGVNDDPDTLSGLLKKLTACGVVPYYIFQCRPVRGVLNYFQVPLLEGSRIVEETKARQSGQGKCLRYVMSHPAGKIEIFGKMRNGQMLFRFHQAKKEADRGRIFCETIRQEQCWLGSIPE